MTKLLSQQISVRQFKMDPYFQTVNKIKEECCYIVPNIWDALKNQMTHKCYYV